MFDETVSIVYIIYYKSAIKETATKKKRRRSKMKYLSNSFSLGMLPEGASPVVVSLTTDQVRDAVVNFSETSRRDYPAVLAAKSIVGHADIAKIIGNMLNVNVPVNRETVSLCCGDILYVAQYVGQRLPEGCTTLPDGATFKWVKVIVEPDVSFRLNILKELHVAYCSDIKALITVASDIWGNVWE